METIGNNNLIAEFMGLRLGSDIGKNLIGERRRYFDENDKDVGVLKYGTWEWLMPVLDRIDALPSTYKVEIRYYTTLGKGYFAEVWTSTSGGWEVRKGTHPTSRRRAVYDAVIDFIEWYNENLKK